MGDLSTFTFQDLRDEIDTAQALANSAKVKQSWERLKHVVTDVTGSSPSGEFDPTSDQGLWWLTRVQVKGFRGTPPAGISIELDSTPGITVIHGPNGSGKSSICSAIDIAMHQDVNASIERLAGQGGKLPVWEPVLVNNDSTNGTVALELRGSDGRILNITTEVHEDAATVLNSSITHIDGRSEAITLGDEWKSAVRAYAPSYAYASWEQHIQRAQDLQQYLEKMLVLGGCFSAVAQFIEDKSIEASKAKTLVADATSAVASRLAELTQRTERTVDFEMPTIDDDPDEWWGQSGLPTPSASPTQAIELSIDKLLQLGGRVRASLMQLGSPDGVRSKVLDALRGLNGIADDLNPLTCPVCASEVPWKDHLHSTIEADSAALEVWEQWKRDLAGLVAESTQVIPLLLSADAPDVCSELHLADAEAKSLQRARDLDGAMASTTTKAAQALINRLDRQEFQAEANSAIERCSADSAWAAELAQVFAPLVECLRSNRSLASESASWAEVKLRLTDLQKRLKKRRESDLKTATNEAVIALLGDAGLAVEGLTVQSRQANLTLRDIAGRSVELGMLSAGQRNAVLLAPALAMAEGGPFGFMIVDDPVHSFDELRVDYVARQLVRISERRRLVVLTHDERLKEHLLAAALHTDARSIRRDAETGAVDVTPNDAMWRVLLDDAQRVLGLPDMPALKLGLTNTLRGLCRQAFDNALRLFVTQQAIRSGAKVTDWIAILDAARTTADRLDAAERVVQNDPAKDRLRSCRGELSTPGLLRDWNRAAHGNDPDTEFADSEIQLTRRVCKALFK